MGRSVETQVVDLISGSNFCGLEESRYSISKPPIVLPIYSHLFLMTQEAAAPHRRMRDALRTA